MSIFTLGIILLLGAFFRLYRIDEYMTFLGDEGRDMLVVKRMIVDHKFTLLGPITSVGSMYMGPIYYYFMTPFLWLANFNPVGPSVMVALFSVATIFLIYKLGIDFFHPAVGLISAFFYALSPLAITSGRSSWNPNIVPFFAVLLIYSLLQVVVRKNYRWLSVAGLSLGVLLQLHYVTFMFIPIILACLLLIKFRLPKRLIASGLLFSLLSYSPFLLFELRHNFVNLQSMLRFIAQQQSSTGIFAFIVQLTSIINDVFVRLFWRLVVVESAELAKVFILVLIASLVIYARKYAKDRNIRLSFKIILVWLVAGILSFGIYRGVTYDYYFSSLFALPFILTGIVLYTLWRYSHKTQVLAVLIFASISLFLFKNNPHFISPSNLLANTRKISEFVAKQADGKPYNFALIAGKNSDHAYRYFLEIWNTAPVVIENPAIDPGRKTVTNQLLVVCEEKVCQPLGHPLWEIAGFGRAEIVGEWDVVTAKVFKLVRYHETPKYE